MKKKKKIIPKWKQLLLKGWKVYNDGMNNKMFETREKAVEAGYPFEGFAVRDQYTRFHRSDLNPPIRRR